MYIIIIQDLWQRNFIIQTVKKYNMNNLLYLIAVILIIGWAIGVFAYSASGIIHVLLVIAIIAILFKVIRGDRVV